MVSEADTRPNVKSAGPNRPVHTGSSSSAAAAASPSTSSKSLYILGCVLIVLLAVAAATVLSSQRKTKPQADVTLCPFHTKTDCCPLAKSMATPSGMQLNYSLIFMRHSIRAPITISKWTRAESFPMGLSHLTKIGKQTSLTLGCILRKFYGDFLPKDPHFVQARSSFVPRCYETLYLVLATMFPPKSVWDFGFPTQPISIHRQPAKTDILRQRCKATSQQEIRDIFNLTHPVLRNNDFANFGEFYMWLRRNSGFETNDDLPRSLWKLADAFVCHKYNKVALPKWAAERYNSIHFANRAAKSFTRNEQVNGALLLKWILNQINERLQKRDLKISLLSYHDDQLLYLLNAIHVDSVFYSPSFAAALHFQVFTSDTAANVEPKIRIQYQQGFKENLTYADAVDLKLSGCDTLCSLSKFARIVNDKWNEMYRSLSSDQQKCHDTLLMQQN